MDQLPISFYCDLDDTFCIFVETNMQHLETSMLALIEVNKQRLLMLEEEFLVLVWEGSLNNA